MIEKIEMWIKWLFEQDITSYRIAQETGNSNQFITGYRNEPWKIENMSLKKAKPIVNYAIELKSKGGNEMYRIEVLNSGEWKPTVYQFSGLITEVSEKAKDIMALDIFNPVWRVLDNKDNVIFEIKEDIEMEEK